MHCAGQERWYPQSMTAHPPTPSEVRSRNRASKRKPRKVPTKCPTCDGTGEIRSAIHHATRCPQCDGSGLAKQAENRQLEAYVN
jgi:DnaJ-class molecular chaperone